MKSFKLVIPLLVLALIFVLTPACTRTDPAAEERIAELERQLEEIKATEEEPAAEEPPEEPEEEPVIEPEEVAAEEPAEEPKEEPEEELELENNFISIGETTSFGEWDYKVIDVEIHKELKSDRARGQYVVFMVEVTNNAKSDKEIGNLFQVEDQEERIFSFDSRASLNYHHEYGTDAWHLEDIGPSFTAVMPIVFDVAEDVEYLLFYPKDMRQEDLNDTAIIMYDFDD